MDIWPAAPKPRVDRMQVRYSPFTSASRIHKVGLFYSHREVGVGVLGEKSPGTNPRLVSGDK